MFLQDANSAVHVDGWCLVGGVVGRQAGEAADQSPVRLQSEILRKTFAEGRVYEGRFRLSVSI